MRFRDRKSRKVIEYFCKGMTPSQIDELGKLQEGTAHDIITAWWLDDKINRVGGADTVLEFL